MAEAQPPNQQHLNNQPLPDIQQPPAQPLQHLKTFKKGEDLLIFLHRFQAYCQALAVPQDMRGTLLIAHLDNKSLRGISRHLNNQLNYDEVVELLKKSLGYTNNNTDQYITQLSERQRLKGEKVMGYFIDLSRISELAYPNPNQQAVKDANLRLHFIQNINHPMLGARLRERPNLNMENLLDLATLLESCYDSSRLTTSQINSVKEMAHNTINRQIDRLTDMVQNLALCQRIQTATEERMTSFHSNQQKERPEDNYEGLILGQDTVVPTGENDENVMASHANELYAEHENTLIIDEDSLPTPYNGNESSPAWEGNGEFNAAQALEYETASENEEMPPLEDEVSDTDYEDGEEDLRHW